MGVKLLLPVVFAGLIARGSAAAQTPDVAVTIYTNNQALVSDSRPLTLKSGRQTIEFKNVAAEIRPETVSLSAPGVAVLEQNFDFDLLTPAKMLDKAVGQSVTIVRTNPANGAETQEKAEILATNGGVVMRIGDRIEVLRDDGLPARVVFDKVPDTLRASPTLSILVDASSAGGRSATLSYLTSGLNWRADYVALFDEAASKLDVQGWVTLTNASGAAFDQAKVLLVAGAPSTGKAGPFRRGPRTLQAAGTETGKRERLGDYFLYPLAERTNIASQQTKQVSFLDVRGAPARHGYEARVAWLESDEQPQSAKTVYRFSTSAVGGLGDQLPAGTVRFYLRDRQGAPQFIGEDEIDHTPMGSSLSLATGDAFDVKVKSAVQRRDVFASDRYRTTMRYLLTNATPAAVTVALTQDGLWGDTAIVAESQKSRRSGADDAEWEVAVPANGQAELTATFETRF